MTAYEQELKTILITIMGLIDFADQDGRSLQGDNMTEYRDIWEPKAKDLLQKTDIDENLFSNLYDGIRQKNLWELNPRLNRKDKYTISRVLTVLSEEYNPEIVEKFDNST